MALLDKASVDKRMDTRLLERNVSKGFLSEAEYKKLLSSLPDDADCATEISLREIQAQMDEEDEEEEDEDEDLDEPLDESSSSEAKV
jgi:hypothetical protein